MIIIENPKCDTWANILICFSYKSLPNSISWYQTFWLSWRQSYYDIYCLNVTSKA